MRSVFGGHRGNHRPSWRRSIAAGLLALAVPGFAAAGPGVTLGANVPWVGYGIDFGRNAWGHAGIGTSGWSTQTFFNSQGFTDAVRRASGPCGAAALEVTVDLAGLHPNRSRGELELGLINHPPVVNGVRLPNAPLDLEGATARVRLWLPPGSAGPSNAPNGIQLIFKTRLSDTDYRSFYTPWTNINPAWQGTCVDLTAPIGNAAPAAVRDPGFNAHQVALIGVKIGVNAASTATIAGSFQLESFTLERTPRLVFDFERLELERDLELLKARGQFEVIRMFVFADGRASPEFNVDNTVSGFDDRFFRDFDELLRIAERTGIQVMPVLLDFHWLDQAGAPVNGVQLGGRSDVIRDAVKRQTFLDNVLRPLLERYPSHPAIYAIDIINEPEWAVSDLVGSPAGVATVTLSQMRVFIGQAAQYVHQYSFHRVTVGSARRSWMPQWNGLGLDFHQFHWYDQHAPQDPFPWPPFTSLGLGGPCSVGEVPTAGTARSAIQFLQATVDTGCESLFLWSIRAGDTSSSLPTVPADGDALPDTWEQAVGLSTHLGSGVDGPGGDPDGDGRTNLDEYREGTHPRGFETRYFAEGATGTFFNTALALLNAGPALSRVLLRFQKEDGTTESRWLAVPPHTSRVVRSDEVFGTSTATFSSVVESDRTVVADRTMTWGQPVYGSHAESALAGPSAIWYLAEGSTSMTPIGDFVLFYLLQNPQAEAVEATVTFLLPSGPPVVRHYTLPPASRTTIAVDAVGPAVAATDVAGVVSATRPIIAERAMYLNRPGQIFTAGHGSAGVTAPAVEWFLAEGNTGPFFELFLLLANPTTDDAQVSIQYLQPGGVTLTKAYVVRASSRRTIWVDDEQFPAGSGNRALANAAVSATITSTNGVPIVVERTMWWPQPIWYEAHNSPGLVTTGTRWAFAGGEVGGPRAAETYVLIANPSSIPGSARVTLFFEDGTAASKVLLFAARSRTSVPVGAPPFAGGFGGIAANRRFGVLVESLGSSPAQIAVEAAMYTSADGVAWSAGSNLVATRLP